MKLHSVYGPSLPEQGWVPAPRYLLRRQLVMDCLKEQEKGRLLEIGPGPAVLLYELAKSGWSCCALEQSRSALYIARELHAEGLGNLYEKPRSCWEEQFDWLLAMEVLEHIDNDCKALVQWRKWLKPNGRILLSVPAHQKKWNHTDVWAGHYRRYERENLVKILEDSGFSVENVMSYGFPIANIIEPIRAWHHGRLLANKEEQDEQLDLMKKNTEQSGISRSLESRVYPLYSNFFGVLLMKSAFWLQKRFLNTDLGTGYLIQACRAD